MLDRVQFYLIFFVGFGALFGALITPLVFWSKGRKPATGFFVGVLVGGFGNLILLIPLWLRLRPRVAPADAFDVSVAFNMGIAAVLGGRKSEARYHFVRVTQADPNNVSAWLYLANLATTPLEAWSYVQQARAIDPRHPGVQDAVSVVWPQVRHLFGEKA